jgi:succinate dehydrogenase/fumarate reductase cytochrome b subunit
MNATLLKALVALIPASILFSGSVVLFSRAKAVGSLLQLVGAGCLLVVVLAHICEALRLFPSMHWGLEHSIGHYLDLSSAVLGLTLFPVGYLLYALPKRHV